MALGPVAGSILSTSLTPPEACHRTLGRPPKAWVEGQGQLGTSADRNPVLEAGDALRKHQ